MQLENDLFPLACLWCQQDVNKWPLRNLESVESEKKSLTEKEKFNYGCKFICNFSTVTSVSVKQNVRYCLTSSAKAAHCLYINDFLSHNHQQSFLV